MNLSYFFKSLSCSFKSLVQDRIVMSDGNKTGLESTWSKVNTVIKHGMEESLEFFGVAFHNFFEAGRTSRAEVNAKHTAGALSGESNAFFFGNLNQTADEFGSLLRNTIFRE